MSNYIKTNNTIPEPIISNVNIQQNFDINALANAVAAAISAKIPMSSTCNSERNETFYIEEKRNLSDTFDSSKTMNRLADQMLVERGKGKANFDDLGTIKTTKKDQKDVDDTIDLLKNLND